jgi:hypothetical protein
MQRQRLPSRIDDEVNNHDLLLERRGHAARAGLQDRWHILNGLVEARWNAGTRAKVELASESTRRIVQ